MREIRDNIYVFSVEYNSSGTIIASRSCKGDCVGKDIFKLLGISKYDKRALFEYWSTEIILDRPFKIKTKDGRRLSFHLLLPDVSTLCIAVERNEELLWDDDTLDDPQSVLSELRGSVTLGMEDSDTAMMINAARYFSSLVGVELNCELMMTSDEIAEEDMVFIPRLCCAFILVLMIFAREFSANRRMSLRISPGISLTKLEASFYIYDSAPSLFSEILCDVAAAYGVSFTTEIFDKMYYCEFAPYMIDTGYTGVKNPPKPPPSSWWNN